MDKKYVILVIFILISIGIGLYNTYKLSKNMPKWTKRYEKLDRDMQNCVTEAKILADRCKCDYAKFLGYWDKMEDKIAWESDDKKEICRSITSLKQDLGVLEQKFNDFKFKNGEN